MSRLLRGVTAQLLILTVLPLTLILGVISFGSIALHQQAMRRLIGERDTRAIVAAAGAISTVFEHKTSALQSYAEMVARETAGPSHQMNITDSLASSGDIASEFPDGVAMVDASGAIIAYYGGPAQWPLSPAQIRSWWPVSGALDSRIGVWKRDFVLRAQDRTRTVTAIGLYPIDALQFNALVNPTNAATTTLNAFLFSAGGRALADTQPELVHSDVQAHPGVAEALRGESGVLYRPDPASGEEHVISYAPIVSSKGQTGLGIIIEEPWEAVLDPLMRYSLAMPLITLPVLLLAMLAVTFGLRRIVQPLQQLDLQARKTGEGDLNALKQPVHGIEEIEQLQSTLREMSEQIQSDRERMRNYAHAVTETQEIERKRLARELHDDTIQNLIVLSQRIQQMRQAIGSDQPQTASRLEELRGAVLQTIDGVRRFSRALRPIYLDEAGLTAALERLAFEAQTTGNSPLCQVTFNTSGQVARLKPDVELALYRIAQEALTNALRHAQPAHVMITLSMIPSGGIRLSIEDDGDGFPPEPAHHDTTSRHTTNAVSGGFGLTGIRERALTIGADVEIHSEPGEGTRVSVVYQPR